MVKHATFEVDLEPELHAELLAAAKATHRPAAEIVSELVRDYLARQHEEPGYEDFLRRKVEKARASMEAGRGRSNEEIEATFSKRRRELASKSQ
jgi:predicted transcriptional regulator